jgi:hypothetical protein
MSDLGYTEFGFDDGKVIKTNNVDQFKQTRSGEKSRISIISFKKFSDGVLANKAREKGSALTDAEKHDFITKIDKKLAEQLNKPVEDLSEVDRIDIKSPRFAFTWTHYMEGSGSFKCLSKYEGMNVVKPEICCNRLGDATQTVGVIVMQYPLKDGVQVDEDLLAQRKYVQFNVWKMSAKKFRQVEDAYREARGDDKFTIDLTVTLDGDPKFQKQLIAAGSNAVWAKGKLDAETRGWVLDQGLRIWKHVAPAIGFEMKLDKLHEKFGLSAGPSSSSGVGAHAELPKSSVSYDDLL